MNRILALNSIGGYICIAHCGTVGLHIGGNLALHHQPHRAPIQTNKHDVIGNTVLHFGVTEYPPRVGGWPSVALNPADTNVMSGLNSRAMGITTVLNAARYSASPQLETGERKKGEREVWRVCVCV